jgi:nitrate reductase NapD
MNPELHISSLVVHAMPGQRAAVDAVIHGLPGAQIHGADASGKLVVTLEAPTSAAILDQVSAIRQAPGVLNVAMVYQHAESLESLNTEIPNDNHTT